MGSIAYYQAVQDAMGGLEATQQFARLYLLPGVGHCTTQPTRFDLFSPLIEWTEQGAQPGGVIANYQAEGEAGRTRPVFPYPTVARYDGSGSIDDAANFVAAQPQTPSNDRVAWAGEFKSGYQAWCTWEGTTLVCRRSDDG
jgi:hypothetical protein